MRPTILVVDDSRMVREIFRQRLAQDQFRVLVAAGGLEALQILSQETPDLILLDLVMPDIDGYQMLQTLKRQSRLKDVPVVVLTSQSQGTDVQKALDLGAADYILKATTPPNEVVRHVTKVLGQSRPAARRYRLSLDPALYDAPTLAADIGLRSFRCTSCGSVLCLVLQTVDEGWTAELVCSACTKPQAGKVAPARTLPPAGANRQAKLVAAPAA